MEVRTGEVWPIEVKVWPTEVGAWAGGALLKKRRVEAVRPG